MGEERKLGLFAVTSLTLVALVGTGMFFGPALSAQYGGPASILAWIILGLNTIYVALIFGELASRYPSAGGIYEFAKQAYGRFPSFMIGWTMWLVATINTSVLIVAAMDYAFPTLAFMPRVIAAMTILIFLHLVAYKGLGATEVVLDFFAGTLLIFITTTIVAGVSKVSTENYTPFFTDPHLLLFVSLFFILETYFGWEAACFLAEETENPERTIPRALIISSVLGVVLGIALTAVLYGIIPAKVLAGSSAPLLDVFTILFGDVGALVLKVGIFLALIGSAAGNIVSGPRLLLAMARDKLFIEQLSHRSKKTGTPGRAILFQAIVSGGVLIAAFGDYTLLLSIMVPLALLMYLPTMLALPILRHKHPEKPAFSCPFPLLGSIFVSVFFLGAFIAWLIFVPESVGILRFIGSLLFFGFPIYLLLSTYYNPSTQLFFSDALAYPALWLESMILPKKIRTRMLGLFTDLQKKTILELGAGVGSLTMHLADLVTPEGKVVAVEAGKSNVDLLLNRIEKKQHDHVHVIHDMHATNRLHPDVQEIDAVFSMGMLGYIQDKQKVLRELAAVMPEHAPIVFMEWIDYFGVLPDPAWLKDHEKLRDEFQQAGFSVRVEKVQGFLWNYLLVYGVRTDEKIAFA